MIDRLIVPRGMNRRHFLGHMATTAMALPALQFAGALEAQAAAPRRNLKSCIVLWMAGGPSTIDTWDLKPESEKNGGEFKPIETSAPGVLIGEHLPTIAKQMKHLAILRSLNSGEGNHDRGTYKMHTGYIPTPTVVHPGFGSILSVELGPKRGEEFPLPHCVAINTAGESAGFLGMAHAPFFIQNPTGEIANLRPKGIEAPRVGRRLQMLGLIEDGFVRQNRGQGAIDHKAVYKKAIRMMDSGYTRAFKLDEESAAVRDAYGRNSFGQGCLMARRLVEAGVSYVEVALGGWDTHAGNFDKLAKDLHPTLDKGMGSLVEDLAGRGMLDSTLIVWMGDFGRTPRVNQNAGRDHWPNSWSVVVGGAGIKGGQAVGATDKDGVEIIDKPIGVMDLVATMTRAMGIDLSTQYTAPNGRPLKLVNDGKPVAELFS